MCKPLPTGQFRWVDLAQDSRFVDAPTLLAYPSEGSTGVFIEVDLDYPEHLHPAHNDLPLAPEKITVSRAHVSPFQSQMADELGLNLGGEKLVTSLNPKRNMVLHIKNIQQYLKLGLELIKVHRVLEFEQSPWLKGYIEKNIEGRRQAKSSFMKNLLAKKSQE